MNQHLIDRLAEEWAQLDPTDPLRGLIADAIAEINKQPAQRKPLTDEQLHAMWTDAVRKAALPPNKSALIHYKEAIEAAHGIGEKK
jgi:hypothetical protein